MNVHNGHAILFLQHTVWHEVISTARLSWHSRRRGRPITDEEAGPATLDVWMQRKSSRPHTQFHGPMMLQATVRCLGLPPIGLLARIGVNPRFARYTS